ncbi:NAD-dependent succinate-semialdehyde dehydrogenase [Nodosilinea sp. LEGE 07088]|uniref:NAD-dependent succinate-semialdehyde dehydrogenase n=1 Tax=Nodosilinea sp. LEGE 07088 TaxID=2777968 RepID=UPI00187ECDC3|nr:NAD-dependent succinate-semialdehyde dehydrogenase [Nodosilinea sp. LEGE 07088]MBE9136197.1 NAD-dependent succinate-semialdehyde dehydrogenase [Nodosilinea sp. LEGE 07088]
MSIASINPATGAEIKTFTPLTDAEIDQKLTVAAATFATYRHTSFDQRATWLRQAAQVLEDNKAAYAKIMTLEMGKPLAAAVAEVEKSALVCRYYADHGADFLADEPATTDASRSFVRYQPLGLILAVMPWNFPFWQVFRFAAPALMAGNVGLLKHASNVPQCALVIEEIFHKAGLPPGAFQTLLIGGARASALVADTRIAAATLTGSEPAGASLAAACGQQIKKTVLELGGSDPFIVMPSADLESAIATAAAARMLNNGQSCIAAKRFIVHESIAERFEQGLTEQFATLVVGNPLDEGVTVGPLATPDIAAELEQQVQACLDQGGNALIGGSVAALKAQLPAGLQGGNWFPPTILAALPPGTPADQEEFFGPVALVFRVASLDDAIARANDIPFGLGASGWSQDPTEQERLIAELEAGAVFINGLVKSDPRLPFGGIKRSGYGRELGRQGMLEFVNTKTVWVK